MHMMHMKSKRLLFETNPDVSSDPTGHKIGIQFFFELSSKPRRCARGYEVGLVVGRGCSRDGSSAMHRLRLDGAGRWAARRFGLTALQRRALGGLQRSACEFLLSTPAAVTVWSPLVGGPLSWRGEGGFGVAWVEYRWPAQAHTRAHAACLTNTMHFLRSRRVAHAHTLAPRRMCLP
jgi:hypothetical protein